MIRHNFFHRVLENIAIYAKSNSRIRHYLLAHPKLNFILRRIYNFLYYSEFTYIKFRLFSRNDYKRFFSKSSSPIGTYYESESIGPLIVNMLFSCKSNKNTHPIELNTLQ